MGRNRILFQEWLVLCLVSLWIVFMIASNRACLGPIGDFVQRREKTIRVTVSGGVDRPGVYEVEAGVLVKKVLELAGAEVSMQKKTLYLHKSLLSSCSLHVPEKIDKKKKKK